MHAGPIANMLAVRFTSRRVVMIGGLIICLGFFLTVFAPNIIYLYFSYGLLVGMLVYVTCIESVKLLTSLVTRPRLQPVCWLSSVFGRDRPGSLLLSMVLPVSQNDPIYFIFQMFLDGTM